jgi:hypothetical protein
MEIFVNLHRDVEPVARNVRKEHRCKVETARDSAALAIFDTQHEHHAWFSLRERTKLMEMFTLISFCETEKV